MLTRNQPRTSRAQIRSLRHLSPFEIKDFLITLAKETTEGNPALFLNAGRGNPNWIATTPRDAFFSLGHFAVEEAKRPLNLLDLGGMPQKAGIASRFNAWLASNKTAPGAKLLRDAVDYGVKNLDSTPTLSFMNSPIPSSAINIPRRIVCSFTRKKSRTLI